MKKRSFILVLFLFFISFGIGYDILKQNINEKKNKEEINNYYEKQEASKETYLGILSIPSIGLKRGFYKEDSSLNHVNKNIMIIYNKMPNLLVLAGHRGNSKVSFFNKLDKMKIGDSIFLNYEHEEKEYLYLDAYSVMKNGNLPLSYDTSKRCLVLITCSKEDKQKQIVYLAYEKM